MTIPQFMVGGLRQEWSEKIASGQQYLASLEALMTLIVDGSEPDQLLTQLDQCRRYNAVLGAEQAVKETQARSLSTDTLAGAIEHLELLKSIRSSERLVCEWLATESHDIFSSDISSIEKMLGLLADPRFDLMVFDDADTALIETYFERGYSRLLRWTEIVKADDERSATDKDSGLIDVKRMDEKLGELPDILHCSPMRVWFISSQKDLVSWERITKEIKDQAQSFFMSRNTVQKWGASWVRQFVSNLPALTQRGRSLSQLADKFQGSGALVIGAGPSLDGAIEWIKSLDSRPLIICAFKALKALTLNGITPDFVVLLDPNQKLRHLEGANTCGIAGFIVEVSVQPDVMAAIDRPLLPYVAGAATEMLADTLKFPMPSKVSSGGSVIHVALQLAVSVGCTEITLIGTDFGFPEQRLYADGAGRGDTFAISEDGRSYLRAPSDAEKRIGTLMAVIANDGNLLRCSLELNQYRLWTERFIREVTLKYPNTRFFNISYAGAVIAGATYIDPSLHRPKSRSAEALAIVDHLPPHVAHHNAGRELRSGLVQQARRLRALGKTCQRASKLGDGGAVKAQHFRELSRRAEDCPEVSLMMSDELIRLEEGVRRGHVWVEGRLVELADTTRRYCDEMSALCSKIEKSLPIGAS